ncbi:MAG: glycosyltransferase family 2 protein [Pyrinomonadaceae bacterium]|nr:glycosyltransferase family 2 protein [Sphingobacteriaceae bacterium]
MNFNFIEPIINNSIFIYSIVIIFSFLVFVLISALEIKHYLRRNRYVSYRELLVSPFAPSISIVVPVFNAEDIIISKVRALFSLQYNNFEVIIINDGSTDNTFKILDDFYKLEAVDYALHEQLKTQNVHHYYKSKNPAYAKLTVIDKVKGGRADALNAGINTSQKDLLLCLELDCFLDTNTLLKMAKPFLEESKQVIAVGSAVHIANSCEIKNGHLININFPKQVLPSFQVIEYFKSFLVERLTWSRLSGLHIISGAIGMFDREILINSGGYSGNTKKEGFEMVVRMSRYMHDNDLAYRVIYTPDPLCWVDCPPGLSQLSKQRKSWAQGNIQTFVLHKDLFLNPKYGFLGLINFPYWFLVEWVTPLFKVLALLSILLMGIFGSVHWEFVGILFLMIYFFAVILSITSILFEEKSYRPYSSGRDLSKILLLSFIEPLIYHPLNVYWKVIAGMSWRKT